MKTTKKEFKNMYAQMRLAGVIDKPLQEVLPMIEKAPKATIENTKETSRYTINNYKDIVTTTIHKVINAFNTFYIVYTITDCSKDNDTSCNDSIHTCVVYVVL